MANSAHEEPGGGGVARGRPATAWTFATVMGVLLVLAGLVVYAGEKYRTVKDATTLLGVVVPAVVSIGAAAFGIRVAYGQGETSGKDQKAREIKTKLGSAVAEARQNTETALRPVQTAATSTSGSDEYVLAAGTDQELRLPAGAIHDALGSMERLGGLIDGL